MSLTSSWTSWLVLTASGVLMVLDTPHRRPSMRQRSCSLPLDRLDSTLRPQPLCPVLDFLACLLSHAAHSVRSVAVPLPSPSMSPAPSLPALGAVRSTTSPLCTRFRLPTSFVGPPCCLVNPQVCHHRLFACADYFPQPSSSTM